MVKVRTPAMASGTHPKRRNGRNFPQRLRVRSAVIPITGSTKASNERLDPSMTPVAAAVRPKTSV